MEVLAVASLVEAHCGARARPAFAPDVAEQAPLSVLADWRAEVPPETCVGKRQRVWREAIDREPAQQDEAPPTVKRLHGLGDGLQRCQGLVLTRQGLDRVPLCGNGIGFLHNLVTLDVGERDRLESRGIERKCVEDVAYWVIAAQQKPGHATIARFRARHEHALAELFSSVLRLCKQAGLVKVGVIAIAGTKVHANASHHSNLDYEQLVREILKEADELDAAEDELYGDDRGDELPEHLRTSEGRRAALMEAQRKLEREREENEGAPSGCWSQSDAFSKTSRSSVTRTRLTSTTGRMDVIAKADGSVAHRSRTSRLRPRRGRSTRPTWTRGM